MNKKYLVLDLETTGEKTFKRFCNPLDLRHTITLFAWKFQGEPTAVECNPSNYEGGIPREKLFDNMDLSKVSFICGHNVKFDLLYFWENEHFQQFLKDGGKVWDTCTVEYLLQGQRRLEKGGYSLNTLAPRYGGEVKDDRIGVMFEEGIKANEIDPGMLMPYAHEDVENTNKLLQGQSKKAKAEGMLPLIGAYMDHYLAITEMENNGMYVDLEVLARHRDIYENKLEGIKDAGVRYTGIENFNLGSNQQVSTFLFGTICSVAEGVLTNLKDHKHSEFIELVLAHRSTSKLLKTYIYCERLYKRANKKKGIVPGDIKSTTGLKSLVMPRTGCIHTNFKANRTRTGRLSSSKPNIQNMPPDVIDIFYSRYGDDGVILEFDYHQLEIVIQAFLTQSKNFIRDIKNGIDFHCKRLAYAEGMSYEAVHERVYDLSGDKEWHLKRKKAKVVSFQKAYGARPERVAESSGLPLSVVKEIFRKEDEEYPEIDIFYNGIFKHITINRIPTNQPIKIRDKQSGTQVERDGEYKAYGTWQSLTGKKYCFEEKACITRNNRVWRYFNLPDIYDYPIQGTAADIMACQVGRVFRKLIHHRNKCLMINEVHDSLILDVKKEHLEWTIETVRTILEDVKSTFSYRFDCDFNIPIKVDYSYGRNWKEAK